MFLLVAVTEALDVGDPVVIQNGDAQPCNMRLPHQVDDHLIDFGSRNCTAIDSSNYTTIRSRGNCVERTKPNNYGEY
jgi:hypothetical protein